MSDHVIEREVVVALGGGGVRGLAHLGVLHRLEEAGVAVRGVAGTSSGAVVGALWLSQGDRARDLMRAFLATGPAVIPDVCDQAGQGWLRRQSGRLKLAWMLADMMLRRHRLALPQYLEQMARLVPDCRIEDLAVPFVAVATDAATGEEVHLSEGSLTLAVAASSAMPGLVAPVPVGGRRLQDGGAVAEIPVVAARRLGFPVVAVEVSEGLPAGNPDRDRFHRAMFRAAAMGWQQLRRRLLAEADWVIAPRVNHLHWAQFDAFDEAYDAGVEAAGEWVNRIRER